MTAIKVFVGDLSELVGKKLVEVEGDDDCSLLLTFEDGATLNIGAVGGSWGWPTSLDLELSYAHSNDR